jgi:hypothetical protein
MRPKRSFLRATSVISIAFLSAAFALLAGCGDGKVTRFPVTGSVLIDGTPADGAMVIFCPTQGSEEVMKLRPFGYTGPDGKFELTTVDKADGSPAGDYKVLIQWPAKQGMDARDGGNLGPDRLRGRYMNLETTQLTAKIEEGPTNLPPFNLKSR